MGKDQRWRLKNVLINGSLMLFFYSSFLSLSLTYTPIQIQLNCDGDDKVHFSSLLPMNHLHMKTKKERKKRITTLFFDNCRSTTLR